MRTSKTNLAATLAAVCLFWTGAPALSVYMIGNSLTIQNDMRDDYQTAIEAVPLSHTRGYQAILGASMQTLWSNTTCCYMYPDASDAKVVLANQPWDIFQGQLHGGSISGEITAAMNYYDLALQANPNCRFVGYPRWPITENPQCAQVGSCNPQFGLEIIDGLTRRYPAKPQVALVPAYDMVVRMRQMANAGQLPGITSSVQIDGSATDGDHLSHIGSYGLVCVWYATHYRRNPSELGLMYPSPPYPQSMVISDTLMKVLRRTAHEVALAYDRCGYYTTAPRFRTRFLPHGVLGTAYTHQVRAHVYHCMPVFAVASGALPPGLTLASNGQISGTPSQAGTYTVTLRVTDTEAKSGTQQFTFDIKPSAPARDSLQASADTDDSNSQPHPNNVTLSGWIWMKFDVSSIRQRIASAKLRFNWVGGRKVVLSGATDAWDENMVSSAQPLESELLVSTPANVAAGPVDYDVTDYVRWQIEHDGTVSFNLHGDPNGASIPSSEDPLGRGPTLILEYSGTVSADDRQSLVPRSVTPVQATHAHAWTIDGRRLTRVQGAASLRTPCGVVVTPSGLDVRIMR